MSRAMGTRSLIAKKGIRRKNGLNHQIYGRSDLSAVSHLPFRTPTTALPGLGTSPRGGAIPGQRSTANRSIQRGSPSSFRPCVVKFGREEAEERAAYVAALCGCQGSLCGCASWLPSDVGA